MHSPGYRTSCTPTRTSYKPGICCRSDKREPYCSGLPYQPCPDTASYQTDTLALPQLDRISRRSRIR
ncbi:hypothetical protein M3J09_013830 [Ascochyta lentis]